MKEVYLLCENDLDIWDDDKWRPLSVYYTLGEARKALHDLINGNVQILHKVSEDEFMYPYSLFHNYKIKPVPLFLTVQEMNEKYALDLCLN